MKRAFFLSLAAIFVTAACTDLSTDPVSVMGDVLLSEDAATPNGPVYVFGEYELVLQSGFAAGQNAHPQAGTFAGGHCAMSNGNVNSGNTSKNTTWFNGPGNWTNAPFCRGTGEQITIVCTTDGIPATYAHAGQGWPSPDPQSTSNEVLNFTEGAWVHYLFNGDETTGQGTLDGLSFTCDDPTVDGGSVDLGLALYSGLGNAFLYLSETGRQLEEVEVDNTMHGLIDLTLSWEYRSRIGEE